MEKIDAVETISLKFKFAIVALVALSGVLAYLIFGNDYWTTGAGSLFADEFHDCRIFQF